MSHSPSDGLEMVKAGKATGRLIQIGSQRVSSVLCAKAKELIAQGTIGDLMMVEGSLGRNDPDRKSTRLNSSHTVISYAVFCLKKKKKTKNLHEFRNTQGIPNVMVL